MSDEFVSAVPTPVADTTGDPADAHPAAGSPTTDALHDDLLEHYRALTRPAPNGSDFHIVHRSAMGALVREIDRLKGLLVAANGAFDECTGDYQKELVEGEPWRAFGGATWDGEDWVTS